MNITVERTTLGVQVRFWADGKALHSQDEGPRKPGHCVHCKRAVHGAIDLCQSYTTDCEQRVWMESRKLRGFK